MKVRDGQIVNSRSTLRGGVGLPPLGGHRDGLGLGTGHDGRESAKSRMSVLADQRHRDVAGLVLMLRNGLEGLPDNVNAAFRKASSRRGVTT